MRHSRSWLPLAVLVLALPLVCIAQTPAYRLVADWPSAVGPQPPDYGTKAVSGVATDATGQVFVFQRTAHPVLVFSREGRYLRSWGEGVFTNPHGCRIDPEGY